MIVLKLVLYIGLKLLRTLELEVLQATRPRCTQRTTLVSQWTSLVALIKNRLSEGFFPTMTIRSSGGGSSGSGPSWFLAFFAIFCAFSPNFLYPLIQALDTESLSSFFWRSRSGCLPTTPYPPHPQSTSAARLDELEATKGYTVSSCKYKV